MDNKDIIDIIRKHKDSATTFKRRRNDEVDENYLLYRDRVITNRLTQRQSVNIPLMKSSMTTLLKEVDELPMLYFENLDNDEQKEIFFNEYWNESTKRNKHATKDIIDKKQAFLCGRSFKKQNIVDGKHVYEIIDWHNMLVDRYADPADIDGTFRCMIHKGIYRPITVLDQDERFKKSAVSKIKRFFATEEGLLRAESNFRDAMVSSERMSKMGLEDVWTPKLGEAYIELWEVYLRQYDKEYDRDIIHVYTVADIDGVDEPLTSDRLCDVLGKTEDDYWCDHTPITTWATDPEHLDIWSDGPGDIIRGPNKTANLWYSQMIENRTLRNYNMNYYDSSNEDFTPQTYTPEPWGWYPMPGNPNDIVKQVEVADLSESLDEIQFVLNVGKEAVAATATAEGQVQTNVTLGEVELALKNAQEKIKHYSVFYNEAWEDFGTKYIKLLEGNAELLSPVKVTKRGRLGKRLYTRVISPQDWLSKSGYRVDVKMLGDKQSEDVEKLQKLNYAKSLMPTNPALDEIIKKKALEFGGLNMNEIKSIMEADKQQMQMMQDMQMMQGQMQDPNLVPTGQVMPMMQ